MRKKRGISGTAICHIMSNIHIGAHTERRTYRYSPMWPAVPIPGSVLHLQDRVRSLLGVSINGFAGESCQDKVERDLLVQLLGGS